MVHFADEVKTGEDAVMLGFHVLNTVDIPRGVSATHLPVLHTETYDYTQWVVVKDLTTKSIYFRVYNDLTIRVVHLSNVKNVEKVKMPFWMPVGGFVDVTDKLSSARNTKTHDEL